MRHPLTLFLFYDELRQEMRQSRTVIAAQTSERNAVMSDDIPLNQKPANGACI
jgi:hypothetical protein